jgi:hypothetical protein
MADPAPPFTVSYPETVRMALREIATRAAEQGRTDQVLAAVRAIDARLKQDPRSFGEPKYRYEELKLVLHFDPSLPAHVAGAIRPSHGLDALA